MNRHDTVTLALRLMGFYVFVELVGTLSTLFTTQANPVIGWMSLAVYLVLSGGLIFGAPWLARCFLGQRSEEPLAIQADTKETQIFFIQLTGIVFALLSVKTLCYQLMSSIQYSDFGNDPFDGFGDDPFGDFGDFSGGGGFGSTPWDYLRYNWSEWTGSLAQFLISIWLILGARGIHQFLTRRTRRKSPRSGTQQ